MYTFTKSFLGFIALLCIGLVSCQGPQGAPGPAGPQGEPGSQTVALMYEVNNFNLTASNKWSSFYTFPAADPIYLEDVVLTYLLVGQDNSSGQNMDVWQLMPISYYNPNGTLSINYNFTANDVEIYASASYTMTAQNTSFTNQVARIVVVPADYSPNGRKALNIDYNDYNQVKKAFNLSDASVKKLTPVAKTKYEGPIIY
ncbi:collagen-like protein [Cytophagaceae bacterium YF14B1]|uniref:Collagen-like protein n=1 Tax=Xanthocytophaga flava TaxID=3048013 RepID=A0AAE3U5F2_9BACT|nr:collagen-like protein [Xanthocytophaga flavus]MDJ1480719.1 collagen-like protein [Xanthocytophaga flavus]